MSRSIPVAKGTLFVGLLFEFIKDPWSYIEKVASYGDLVQVSLGGKKLVYVFHPDAVQTILVKNRGNYPKGKMMDRTKLVFGNGLVVSEGALWTRQRRRLAHSFIPKFVDAFAPLIEERAEAFFVDKKGVRAVDDDFMELTLNLVLDLLFGSIPADSTNVVKESFEEISRFFASSAEFFIQLPLWVPTPGNLRFKSAMSKMDRIVEELIQSNTEQGSQPNLLSRILESEEMTPIDEQLLYDEIRTLMLAGHETTSLALTFSLWFLSEDLDLQERLYLELEEESIQPAAAMCSKSIEQVVRESLRILPPVPIVTREALQEDVVLDYKIPAGTTLILCPFRTHNDPRWFAEPHKFKPERWTEELLEHLPRFAYYPFGGGPRVCIGMRMAMMEATIILSVIVRRFVVSRVPESKLDLQPSITLRTKSSLKLVLTPR